MSPDSSIIEILKRKSPRPILSVEFFPPKDEQGAGLLKQIAQGLKKIKPDFASVTYGAGGSTRQRTAGLSQILREELGYTVMPHLTCVGSTKEEILAIAKDFHSRGFRNIMALRGDPPQGETSFQPIKDGLSYAGDLVKLLKENFPDFCLGVAGYPEKHPEAESMEKDLNCLKSKVEAGGSFITTQLFFENKLYFDFAQRCRALKITVPIIPGIMPVLSFKQIQRFTEMCGASLPAPLVKQLESADGDPAKTEQIGIQWAAEQIRELLQSGAPGVHLYVLNRERPALALFHAIEDLLK